MKNRRIINVLDTELTCYENDAVPPGQHREIIEIGVSTVDLRTLEVLGSISLPVIPVRSEVSPYCTALTGWSYGLLKKRGMPFAEACRRLRSKHGSGSRLVVTDASDELDTIKSQCAEMGVEYPFGNDCFNASALFTMVALPPRQLSLKEKLAWLGMDFVGIEHRAIDDSLNLARLYIRLMQMFRGVMPPPVRQSGAN